MHGALLAPVDAAWLHMDRATNRMVITAVLLVDGVLEKDELARLLAERLPHDRFRQRIVEPGVLRRPRFVDSAVDFADHVVVAPWPAPHDERALEGVVGVLAATPLDPARPLWCVHLLVAADRCAVVFRAHHCLADGLALVRVLRDVVDADGAGDVQRVGAPRASPAHTLLRRVGRGAMHGASLARMLALPPDPHEPWKRAPTVHKTTAWTGPVPLDELKRAAHAVNAHLTDALLACVTGALARARPDTRRLRALVPAFLDGDAGGLGNRFGLVYIALPVRERDPLARLRRVRARTASRKQSVDAVVALEILGALGRVSRRIEDAGVAVFSSKASAMVTSVPGPKAAVRVLGHEVQDVIAFGPAAGSIALTAGLFSYRGHVRVAFAVDPALGVGARALAEGFEAEAGALTGAAGAA